MLTHTLCGNCSGGVECDHVTGNCANGSGKSHNVHSKRFVLLFFR